MDARLPVSLNIQLVSMPFSALELPSIALTQLKSVTQKLLGEKVAIEIKYLNHAIASRLGLDTYAFVTRSHVSHVTGLGEWLFRAAAFPDHPDNKAEYFGRYGSHFGGDLRALFERRIEPFRASLAQVLDEIIDAHHLDAADVVGLTSMFSQNLASIALARRLKRRNPKQIIVLGGANCEGTMGIELVTNTEVIDFVFSGPSLVSFPKFVRCILERDLEGCHRIHGVFSRNNAMSIQEVGAPQDGHFEAVKPQTQLRGIAPYGMELDINSAIDLDYEDYFDSVTRSVPTVMAQATIPFETSRGCWWGERAHCTFCGLNGSTMAYRAMRPELARDQMLRLFALYAGRAKLFQSVDNILAREYIDGVFGSLTPPDDITIFYEVKADLTEENVRTLARARVLRVQPGIESLATSTLKLMRKGTTAFHNIRLLKYCKRYKVVPEWNLLMGFPGEPAAVYEQYKRTLPGLFHLPPPAGAFTVRFDRFSPYFTNAQHYGLRLSPYDFYSMCYPFPSAVLANMAYYFEDRNVDAPYATDAANWIGEMGDLVARWRARWADADEPRLEIRTGGQAGNSVLDTRTGARRIVALSSEEAQLLQTLNAVVPEDELRPQYAGALSVLRQKGLMFGERGRLMSVACEA